MHPQRNLREFRARSRSTRAIFFHVALLVALVWSCGSFAEKKNWESQQSSLKCTGKNIICLKISPELPNSNGINSLPCPFGRNTKPFTRPQETVNSCHIFCCPGCHRSNKSRVQTRYKVVLQTLYQSGRRNKVYLAP